MKKFVVFVLVCVFVMSVCGSVCSYAKTGGAGGYNQYRTRKYDSKSAEELDELERVIKEDGYILLTPENNWGELADDEKFLYNAFLNEGQYQYYHIWVDKRDYESYKNSDDAHKNSEAAILYNNAVVVSRYTLIASEWSTDNPTGKTGKDIPEGKATGTIIINVDNKTDCQTDVIVVMKKLEDLQYYSFRVNKANDYHLTETVISGTYFISSVMLNDTERAIYDPDLGEKGNGITVAPGDTAEFSIGFGTDILPQSSWKVNETGKEYITFAPTQSPERTESPTQNNQPVPKTPKETKEGNKTVIIIIIVVGVLLVAGGIYIFIKKKQNEDNMF